MCHPKIEFDEKKVDDLFAKIDQCHLPGAVVGIAIGGKPVYRKGFGLASMELPLILSPSMRIRIGNMSKQFTALAYLLLCEEGRAGLDDPLKAHLPDLHPVLHPIRMLQLMAHLGGLSDACSIKFRFGGIGGRPVSSREIVELYCDLQELNASPGTTWMYSNAGYVLLSAVIERVAGQPLEEVLRTRIFEPLGMHDTMLRRWDHDFLPNSASLHMRTQEASYERWSWGLDFSGARSVVSTVDDMLRWLAHMDEPVIGSESTWTAMKTPQVLANGTPSSYGLGLWVERRNDLELISHLGGWLGGSAQMFKVPAAGLDVIVMVNRHDISAMDLADRILEVCLPGARRVQDVAPRPVASGVFRSPLTGRIVQLFGLKGQQFASFDGYELPLAAYSDGRLRTVGALAFLKLEVALTGDLESPAAIHLLDFGNSDELARLPEVRSDDPSAIVGRYCSPAIGTELTISHTAEGMRLVTGGRFGSTAYDLHCIAQDVWLARSVDATKILNEHRTVSLISGGIRFSFYTESTRLERC